MPPEFSSRTFYAPETTIVYEEGPGNGVPVVFIHSLGTRRQYWAAVLPEFTSDHHVFAPDLRGHGESGRVPGGYRFTHYARDIVPWLREIVRKPAVLVGHSLGGVVATVIAADHPDLVASVIAIDPPLFTNRKTRNSSGDPARYRERFRRARDLAASGMTEDELFATLQERSPDRPENVSRSIAGNLANLDPDVFTLALEGGKQIDFDPEDLIRRLSRPMLIVRADPANGAAVTEDDARWATETNPLISCGLIEGSAHEVHHSHRELFVQTTRDFINSA